MSYNITHSSYLTGKLSIQATKAKRVLAKLHGYVPTNCFLTALLASLEKYHGHATDMLAIEDPAWTGEWSGNTFARLIEEVLPKTAGCAQLLFVWEGGDSMSGLLVENGVVYKKTPKVILTD